MITLILGGSGSGKSSYAETLAVSKKNGPLYYLATMKVYGKEGKAKVKRHQILRQGKGFITIESPKNVGDVLDMIEDENATVLLECMSNLVANEMFLDNGTLNAFRVADKIRQDIVRLSGAVNHLVIVTNNVFEDGICYDAGTMEYIKALGLVNRLLAELSTEVWEVVVGIPLQLK